MMMDVRHPLKEFDVQMLSWANQADLSVHILLTKADKLKNSAAKQSLFKVVSELKKHNLNASVQLFSSLNKSGRDEAVEKLDEWFEVELVGSTE